MKNGFIKVAAALPKIEVAAPSINLKEHIRIFENAKEQGVKLLVFPELSITGCTAGDLFLSDTLLRNAQEAVIEYCKETATSDTISIIGFPFVVNDKIYNSSAICQKGQILGIVPKKILQNFGINSDSRYFSCIDSTDIVKFSGQEVPFGSDILFRCQSLPSFRFGVEIGSDALASCPPSVYLTESGATVIANPHAAAHFVGQEKYRKSAISATSARLNCAYILSGNGYGESTTDVVFGGHSLIAENGDILAEKKAFNEIENGLLVSEIDLEMISYERRRKSNTFVTDDIISVDFDLDVTETTLTRHFSSSPFIPECEEERVARCRDILKIQAHGLAHRMVKAYASKCVIGISGGLDSCLAVLVAAEACDILGRPRTDIIGVTMPCFGTTKRTRSNAQILCEELGADFRTVDIGESVKRHFIDIGHDESNRNVVYENAQARERTQVIMDIANMENGIVVGTGDLSELALGWATYNGDHMSMYGVNADVPKTLIRHITSVYADDAFNVGKVALAAVLRDILDTPVSPELLPADENGEIAQKTEDIVGPYEIHDFYIYYMLRYGFTPDKLFRLAKKALGDKYSDEILLRWLKNLIRRFFSQQFKRSCLADGPKVGSVGVSPRGDWHMPSDASSAEWMKMVENIKI